MNDILLKKLITDEYFGIYTRNGLEYLFENTKDDYHVYLLDFDNIKEMNDRLGYKQVNDIFKKTFSEMEDKFIIGRVFSGDEIAFFTNSEDAETWVIPFLRKICFDNGLLFEYIYTYFDPSKITFKDMLNKMIDKLH